MSFWNTWTQNSPMADEGERMVSWFFGTNSSKSKWFEREQGSYSWPSTDHPFIPPF